jgi:hypothetical protein
VYSLQATPVWRDGVTSIFEGFDRFGNAVATQGPMVFGRPDAGPTLIVFDPVWQTAPIYQLKVTNSGGTNVVLGGEGPHLTFDDIIIAPP